MLSNRKIKKIKTYKQTESLWFIYSNPTTRLITAAGMLRHFSDAIIGSFGPAFLMMTYPGFVVEFAFI